MATPLETFTPDAPLVMLGCGKMGGAMLDGWLAKGIDPAAVTVIDPDPSERLKSLSDERGTVLRGTDPYDGPEPRAVLLAVKPQMMAEALPTVEGPKGGGTLYVSIAAGTTTAFFQERLGAKTPIVRVMPNTPAAIGRGASALFASEACSDEDRAVARAMTDAVGLSVWIEDEALMDAVTGVSGSGPAYVFHMIEALAAAGEAAGLPADTALTLARQTVIGAAALAEETGESAETLRVNVTSPGGTTEAGLAVLMGENGLRSLLQQTVQEAKNRSISLR